jgi:hypothetical protein
MSLPLFMSWCGLTLEDEVNLWLRIFAGCRRVVRGPMLGRTDEPVAKVVPTGEPPPKRLAFKELRERPIRTLELLAPNRFSFEGIASNRSPA